MIEFPRELHAAARLHTDMILRLPNIVAVGVGQRSVGGRETDEPAVVVSVSRKLPKDALRSEERVPALLESDGGTVRTDVIEVGQPHYADIDNLQYRPLRGGCQIQVVDGSAGTGGALMYDRRDQQVVLLTNAHVLTTTDPLNLPTDTRVWQGGVIGNSKRLAPMGLAELGASDHTHYATVDAGIVALDSSIAVEFNVVEIPGRHPFVVLPPFKGLDVIRRGFRTQLRTGTIECVDQTVIMTPPNGQRHRIGPGVFSIRSPERLISAMKGDSGSLVVDAAAGAARGLVFGTDQQSGGLTYACDLRLVMNILELDTVCTGALNALIRRAAFRRMVDKWAVAQQPTGSNVLVAELIEKVDRFRDSHLKPKSDRSVGSAIGAALHRLGPDLASAITSDEEAAGLLDRAFGEWLIQPTVFDMLEYRFGPDTGAWLAAAFGRLRDGCEYNEDLDLLERVFTQAPGRTMRELLGRGVATPVELAGVP